MVLVPVPPFRPALAPLACYGAVALDKSCPTLALLASRYAVTVSAVRSVNFMYSLVGPVPLCMCMHALLLVLRCPVWCRCPSRFFQQRYSPNSQSTRRGCWGRELRSSTMCDGYGCRGMMSSRTPQRCCCGGAVAMAPFEGNLRHLTYGNWEAGQRWLGGGGRRRKSS